MDQYADDPRVVFLGIELDGPDGDVDNWVEFYGWDFYVGINGEDNTIYSDYGLWYDTFITVGGDGVITYVNGAPNSTGDFPGFVASIEAALATVPVEPITWSKIKNLYP